MKQAGRGTLPIAVRAAAPACPSALVGMFELRGLRG